MWKKTEKGREGFYQKKVKLAKDSSSNSSDDYDTIVHVRELDKYTNGASKICLVKVEILAGFDYLQYDHVKKLVKEQFVSLKNTTDITWLDSEFDIKKARKEKLLKLKNRGIFYKIKTIFK